MDDRQIFLEALNRPTAEERTAYLDEACGDDSELRKRVELLLAAHEDAGSFLEKTPEELLATLGQEVDLDAWKELLTPSDKDDCLGLLGRYEIRELIGRGGMGVVLSARDPQLNRVVAIKMLAPELSTHPLSVRRFLREAQATAAVSHDHVITIHAVDEQAKPPLIVMERIAGQSLQEKIDREGPLDVKSILRIGMQTASGLAAAHKQGLIHRDIKPSNILLENGIERVKLTDFGLARAVDDIGMTRTGQITGTPQYMSPEQAQGYAIDHRTDLFSLGCVLYAMCTGQAAFRADSAIAVMHRVVHEPPRPIREINEDIPDWLCRIVEKLMEKDPDRRFSSASEVEDLLGRHLAHLQQPESVPLPELVQASAIQRTEDSNEELGSASRTLLAAGLASLAFFVLTFLALSSGWLRHPLSAVMMLIPALLSLPAGLLAMNAYWDIPRRKRYWWVYAAALAAVIPWNPFLLLMLPWTLRALRTLQNPAVKQEFADIANSINSSEQPTAADSLTIGNALSKALTPRRFLAAGFVLILAFTAWGIQKVFDHPYLLFEQVNRQRPAWQGRLVIKPGYEDVFHKLKGPAYAGAGHGSFSGSLPPGQYLIMAWRSLGEGNSAYHVGQYTVRKGQTTIVKLEQNLARPGIADFDAIEPFLADSPEIATLRITVDDPEVRLTINGVTWDIAGKGEQIVPLKPGRYEFLGMKRSETVFEQTVTLNAGEEKTVDSGIPRWVEFSPKSPSRANRSIQHDNETPDWKQLLSQAASIPLDEWSTLSGDVKGPNEAAVRGEPLSLVLFQLNPLQAAKDNDKVRQDFWYLTETIPKPADIGKAISISYEKGYVSFLQPEYITNVAVDINGESAAGHAGFTVPKLDSGRVEFKAQQLNGNWKITEFTLPNYGIILQPDEEGLWQREISTIPLSITIGKDGDLSIQSNRVEWADLDQTLRDRRKSMGDQRVLLKVHRDVPVEKVEEAVDLLKKYYESEIRVSTLSNP